MVIRIVFVRTPFSMMMLMRLMDQTGLLKQGMRSDRWPNRQQEHCNDPPTNPHQPKISCCALTAREDIQPIRVKFRTQIPRHQWVEHLVRSAKARALQKLRAA